MTQGIDVEQREISKSFDQFENEYEKFLNSKNKILQKLCQDLWNSLGQFEDSHF